MLEDILRQGRRRATNPSFDDPSLPEQYPPDLELEPIHLELDLRVDLDDQFVEGTVTTTVRARRTGPVTLRLDAVDFASVSVEDPDNHPISHSYDGTKLIITWAHAFQEQETRRIAVTYRVVQPAAGLYFSKPDSAYPEQAWYVASDHETERARDRLPCIDLPNVRTTLDFHLRAADRYTILANGRLVEEVTHNDGTKTAHWRLEQLCPSYLLCFAVGDFTAAQDGLFVTGENEIPIAYFSSREHSPAALVRTFGRTRAMLTWLTGKLEMPFPYPKYYQFALPGINGAMENISLVSWTDRYVQDEILAAEVQWYVDQINVHEMAHSYFGDSIVCRDFAHAWLKESWATYIEQEWRADSASRDEAQYVYYQHAARYFSEADEQYQRSIVTRRFKSSWDLYDAHLYEGGACRLHTLCNELGAETFWPAVRAYLRRYSGHVVETDDFRAVLEEHSGRSLGKFFDQWFYKKGYPDLKVTFEYDETRRQGSFTVEQKQVDQEKGIPVFDLTTDLGWTIEGVDHRLPIKVAEARQVFLIPMPSKPEQVRFDPDGKALHKLEFSPGDTLLRRQLTSAPDVIGRIQAAHTLAKTSKRANLQAIVDAYMDEPFWGVRREFAKALGSADHETAVAGLAALVATEQDPMALADLIRAAGNYRDVHIRDAVARRVAQGLPHLAAQAAYETLGAQRDEAPWEVLLTAAGTPSYNGLAQSGALRGLAATRRNEAIAFLRAKAAYGNCPNRARPAAVAGSADIGKGQEKNAREQIVEQLIDLLRDPWQPVAWASARGLQAMQVPEAIPALTGFGRSLSHQEQTEVERLVASMRDADKRDGSAVKKQVEDLREKVRKLEEQIQELEAQLRPEAGV